MFHVNFAKALWAAEAWTLWQWNISSPAAILSDVDIVCSLHHLLLTTATVSRWSI